MGLTARLSPRYVWDFFSPVEELIRFGRLKANGTPHLTHFLKRSFSGNTHEGSPGLHNRFQRGKGQGHWSHFGDVLAML